MLVFFFAQNFVNKSRTNAYNCKRVNSKIIMILEFKTSIMINYSEVFIYSNQPTTCPLCGACTKIILDLSHTKYQTQIHKCHNKNCNFEFIIQFDDDFDEETML